MEYQEKYLKTLAELERINELIDKAKRDVVSKSLDVDYDVMYHEMSKGYEKIIEATQVRLSKICFAPIVEKINLTLKG